MKKCLLISVIIFVITVGFTLNLENSSNYSISNQIFQNEIIKEDQVNRKGEEEFYERGSYEEFKRINEDVMLVLHFDDRDIPVVFNQDNDFYVRRNLIKEASSMGTAFIDKYTGLNGRNLLIHAHSSLNNERMFTFFKYFCNQEYYEEHSFFMIETENQKRDMVVFAVMKINLDQDEYRDWMKSEWRNENEFMNFISDIKEKSLIKTTVEVNPDDSFITMVTCDMSIENGRIIVFAKENI